MRKYKVRWTATGTMTVESESKALAIELAEDILHNDLEATDTEEFNVETAAAT